MEDERKLNHKQTKALDALLDGANIQDAAHAAGVNRKTVARWLDEPHFWTVYQQASERMLKSTSKRMASTMDAAVDVIAGVMEDEDAPPGVRLRAAQLAIDSGLRLLDAVDVVERLDELERRVAGL